MHQQYRTAPGVGGGRESRGWREGGREGGREATGLMLIEIQPRLTVWQESKQRQIRIRGGKSAEREKNSENDNYSVERDTGGVGPSLLQLLRIIVCLY